MLNPATRRGPERRPLEPRKLRVVCRAARGARFLVVAALALGVSGCPQLLSDDFHNDDLEFHSSGGGGRDARGATDSAGSGGGSARAGSSSGGTAGAAGSAGSSGRTGDGWWGTWGCSDCTTCGNGVQDNGETGVDCGGPCAPCGCTWSAFSTPEPVTVQGLPPGSSLYGPALSSDGSTIYFSSLSTGTQDLYSATRTDHGAVFSGASSAAFASVNTPAHETNPWLSSDGLHLHFSSDVAGTGALGAGDIYHSIRSSTSSPFGLPVNESTINSSALDNLEWLSPDELSIYFSSTRPNTPGSANIWFAQRTSRTASFGAPRALNELNSDANDQGPSLSSDQLTIYFSSDRDVAGSQGKFDIWIATRASTGAPFGPAVIVPNVNSAADELDVSISFDGTELFFSSERTPGPPPPMPPPGGTPHTLWRSTRSCQ
jgi:hypothetical protein